MLGTYLNGDGFLLSQEAILAWAGPVANAGTKAALP